MCAKKLCVAISLVLLAVLVISPANATYTDYIGAGHASGVTVATCVNDDTASGAKTVDGSGLSGPSGTHDTVWDHGWLAYPEDLAPNPNSARSSYDYWIKYDFGEVYLLDDMWIWNSNEGCCTDRGFRNVHIDYSVNGSSWTQLTSTQFSVATGSDSYSGFQGPDFGGVSARYVLISAVTNWGASGWYGLAEVKFYVHTGPPDTDPPTPDPPTWSSVPTALGPYSIGMTVNPVTDPSGVQYFFDETTGAGHDSIWQAEQDYTDSGLSPSTLYTYKVKARDLSVNNNETGWSTAGSDTTDPPDTTAPTPNPPTWASPPAAADPWTVTMTANTGTDDNSIQYYFKNVTDDSHDSDWQSNNSYTDQFLNPQTQYTYRIKMRDLSPQLNETGLSDPCSATTDELPILECPDVDLDDDCVCDGDDLLIFAAQWMDPPGCTGHPNDCANLNEQDGVDGADFVVLVADWQESGIPIAPVINEMMASNTATIADEDGDYDDWIEIFNPAPYPVSMGGMILEDNDGFRWEVPPNVGINAGEHLLFWADDGWPDDGNYHTNFKLGKDGDGVTLYDTDGSTVLDTKSFSSMDADISYGRYSDATDNWYDMANPTPGSTNAMGMAGKVYCSRPAGLFTDSFSLGLTAKSPAATIYYTTSGSEPNEFTSQLYTGLIPVANTTVIRAAAFQPGYSRGPVETNTYILLDDVYSQPALPDGFPDVWHIGDPGDPFPLDFPVNYEMHPDVITEYAAHLQDAFTSIPTMSLVMDMNDLFGLGPYEGIYSNSCWPGGGESGPRIENPASVELITSDGTEGFDIDCGARIYGAGSRNPEENLKHTFRLLFKGMYGATKLNYPFFEDSPVEQFDTIVLRGGNNFKWNNFGSEEYYREIAQYIRDNWAKDSQLAMGHPSSRSNYVHLYLNGLYWGLYMPCERPSGPFLADHLGGEREDYDALNSGEAIEGDRVAWEAMMAIANGGLSSQSAYDNIQEYLDVENLIDFVIVEHYTQNTDWAESNWYAGRIRLPGAGYKLFVWDTEYSFFDEYEYTVEEDHPDSPRQLYNQLRDNAEFRLLFADHVHRHFFNYGLMTPGPCAQRWMRRANEIHDAIIGESARWGDSNMDEHGGLPYTRDGDWIPARDWIINTFMSVRTDILLSQYIAIGLYPIVDAPAFNINGSYQHGGYVPSGASLTMTNAGGTIHYTTDGSDPRLQGGAVSGSASSALPYTLNDTKKIKARVLDTGGWSALNEAIFAVGPIVDNLRITEIMYNVDDPNHEYIELKNIGGTAIDLNLVKFTDGIDFTFPSLSLPAGDYCVVVRNTVSFNARYTSFSGLIAGEFIGAINNAGERIELVDALGQVIHNFRFKDGWYPITDGEDFSLNIIDPCDSDPNSWEYAIYWQPSSVAGGTPSADDTGHVAAPGDIVINEVMTHTNSYPNDWIELHNTTGSPIDITGWFLSDNDNNFKRYEIGVSGSVTIPLNGYVVFTQDDDFGDAGDPGSDVQFAFSELGETVYLCSGSGGVLTGGFCTKEDFKASEDEVSFGRYTKSAAAGYDVDFVSMTAATKVPPNTNTTPKVGPIVITEIMYHPPDPNSYAEYVEIKNISGTTVSLDDWLLSDESGGIEYYIPAGTSLTNGSSLLLVKNQVAFENVFGPAGVTVLEWLGGRLNNAGEKIQISKPGTPEPSGFVPYIRVDRVNYSDGSHGENFRELNYNDPWPTSPDIGVPRKSLHRVVDGNYGNDVANWTAATPSPGY